MKLPIKCHNCGCLSIGTILDAKPCEMCEGTSFAMASDKECLWIFSGMMAEKMRLSAEKKGRSGWQTLSAEKISAMLRDHVEKGDPVDVANFCMMLSVQGWGISAMTHPCWSCQQPVTEQQRAEAEGNCPHCSVELDNWPPICQQTVEQLRDSDHVVIIWNPEEIGAADPGHLEDLATSRGNDYLADFEEDVDD